MSAAESRAMFFGAGILNGLWTIFIIRSGVNEEANLKQWIAAGYIPTEGMWRNVSSLWMLSGVGVAATLALLAVSLMAGRSSDTSSDDNEKVSLEKEEDVS